MSNRMIIRDIRAAIRTYGWIPQIAPRGEPMRDTREYLDMVREFALNQDVLCPTAGFDGECAVGFGT
jgi:hypothetical protein